MAPQRVFRLTPAVRLFIHRGDITTFRGDALVNAANEGMLGGGGVDGAIHRAAGPALRQACAAVPPVRPGVRCPVGEARITPGRFGRLQVDHVIHTVGPIYHGEAHSAPLLDSAYRSCMKLLREHKLESVAFPAVSCGVYGYPLDSAAAVALRACREEAESCPALREVHLYLFGQHEVDAWVDEAEERLESDEDGSSGGGGSSSSSASWSV